MSLILQLETSTDVCSVALSDNGHILALTESDVPNSHSELITILIRDCMQEAGFKLQDISAVALSDGPGSYTSLRVGASTAKGICYVIGCPLITIDSLSILALGIDPGIITERDFIVPMIDARRMEVYMSVFDSQYEAISPTAAMILDQDTLKAYRNEKNRIHICGNGAIKYADQYKSTDIVLHHTKATAAYMTSLAVKYYEIQKFNDVAYYTPNYFKAPNITKSLKKLF
jgi:tRNA threonylcarbamoyladenosine biosynthesis protein TsaB